MIQHALIFVIVLSFSNSSDLFALDSPSLLITEHIETKHCGYLLHSYVAHIIGVFGLILPCNNNMGGWPYILHQIWKDVGWFKRGYVYI